MAGFCSAVDRLGLVSLLVGLYALIWEPLNAKWIAATMVAFGIITLIITHYEHNKAAYSEEGERLTALFYRLRDLLRDKQGLIRKFGAAWPTRPLEA